MSGIIFTKKDKNIVATYPTERGAKIALTRAKNENGKIRGTKARECDVLDATTFYGLYDELVEKTNLMSGEKFMDSKYTPIHCDPSSETYWSM